MARDLNKTLYVSDMDGTLLGPDARLTRRSAELLNRAISGGVKFTVATARTPATVEPLLEDVAMRLPAIVMTGAARWHFDTETYSHLRFISQGHVRTILSILDQGGIFPFVYTLPPDSNRLTVFYSNPSPSAADLKFIEQRRGLKLKTFVLDTKLPPDRSDRVLLFFASGDYTSLGRAAEQISAMTQCSVSCYDDIYNPGLGLIEIFAPEVSKASAIEELKADYEASQVTVFGDNLNDLPMFAVADTSVAVENACESVKCAADIVIGPNTSDAVPEYLLKTLDF